jgi:hypothetical protein
MVTMGVGSASLLAGSFMLVSQSHICTCQGDTYVCGINDRWGGKERKEKDITDKYVHISAKRT